jgi:hypothetical protein
MALMLGIALVFLAAVPLVYRRFGLEYAVFAGLSVLVCLGSGLPGVNRYVTVDFPAFAAVVLALLSHRRALVGLFTMNAWLLLFLTASFAAGWGVY